MHAVHEAWFLADEIVRQDGIFLCRQGSLAIENIIGDDRWCLGLSFDLQKSSAFQQVIDERVVANVKVGVGISRVTTFHAVTEKGGILSFRALLDDISDDIGSPAIGKIQFKAGGAIRFVT